MSDRPRSEHPSWSPGRALSNVELEAILNDEQVVDPEAHSDHVHVYAVPDLATEAAYQLTPDPGRR